MTKILKILILLTILFSLSSTTQPSSPNDEEQEEVTTEEVWHRVLDETTTTTISSNKIHNTRPSIVVQPAAAAVHVELKTINRKTPFTNPILKCTKDIECKAACGSLATDHQCNDERGNCLCIHLHGPPKRCRNIKPFENECNYTCGRRISQICFTDFGNLCTCFIRN